MAIRYEPDSEPIASSGDEHPIEELTADPRTDWGRYLAARTAFLTTLRHDALGHWLAVAVDEILAAADGPASPRADDDGLLQHR